MLHIPIIHIVLLIATAIHLSPVQSAVTLKSVMCKVYVQLHAV